MTAVYSYGDPDNPLPDDPRFATEDAAISEACNKTGSAFWFDGILAVWVEEDGNAELLALIHNGLDYRP